MGVYQRGNAITIVQRFSLVDPLTEEPTPADPTTVVFTVRDPDGVETVYEYGVAVNVTRAEVGVYLCALQPQLPAGGYAYRCVGTGTVEAAGEGTFTILDSGVEVPDYPEVAELGPCSGWIDGGYVADWDTTLGVGSSSYLLDTIAAVASQLVFELSARLYPGVCRRKVRPCRQGCACYGFSPSLGLGPWYWTSSWFGGVGSWNWRNECGDTCGCGSESYIRLAGDPVRRVLEVKLDGAVLDPSEYRLDGRRYLIRLADTSQTPPRDRAWPVCQDLSLPDSEPATFSVLYEWGQEPPELGKLAAAQLAAELWRASPANQGECRLPAKVTRVVRQGVTMERVVPLASVLRSGATGLPLLDAFIAQENPQGARRRSLVWSPDLQPYARQVGQDEYGF
jgi:hypothetical protein